MTIKHICEVCGTERDITVVAEEWVHDGFIRTCQDCTKIEQAAKMAVQARLTEMRPKMLSEELARIKAERAVAKAFGQFQDGNAVART